MTETTGWSKTNQGLALVGLVEDHGCRSILRQAISDCWDRQRLRKTGMLSMKLGPKFLTNPADRLCRPGSELCLSSHRPSDEIQTS